MVAEDAVIALDIAVALTDVDGSETITAITMSGVPGGATLSAGTDNGGGSWTPTPAQLGGLTLTPAPDSDAEFMLTVNATATEAAGGSATGVATLHVSVTGIADVPSVVVAEAAGAEDTASALDIAVALTDIDGSETITAITVSDVPEGATLSAGTDNGNGSWTLTPAQLAGLNLTAASAAAFTLSVAATATETESGDTAVTAGTIDVTVAPAASIVGTPGPDVMIGTRGADVIDSLGGDDTVHSGRGDDVVDGGAGADTLEGGRGADALGGGSGEDITLRRRGRRHVGGRKRRGHSLRRRGRRHADRGLRTGRALRRRGPEHIRLPAGLGRRRRHQGLHKRQGHAGLQQRSVRGRPRRTDLDDRSRLVRVIPDFDASSSPPSNAAFVFDSSSGDLYYDHGETGKAYTLIANLEDVDIVDNDFRMI